MARKRFSIETIFHAVDKVTRPVRRMTRAVVRGAKIMGRALMRLTKLAGKLGRGLLGAAAGAVKFGGVGAAGLATGVTLLNKGTVQADRLSKAVNVSTDSMEALASAIKPAGFEIDNVIDLVEEMNNKFGESAGLQQTLPVQEALTMLGLRFEQLKKLKPEEQFRTITNAILKFNDAQQASSAADILFGSDANKVFGALRDTGKDFDGLIDRYKELNFQTDASRAGAGAFVRQLGRVTTLISTMARFIAGLAGDAMAPMIEQWANWVIQNKELIRTKILEFVAKLPGILEQISNGAATAFEHMDKWAEVIEPLKTILKLMGKIAQLTNKVGTFLGETAAKTVMGVQKFRDRLANLGGTGLAGGDAGSLNAMSSPQERTANILEERRTTNTTEVVIRDSSGRAQVERGGKNPGFNMIATGAM